MAVHALSAFLYGMSHFWLLFVFSALSVGVAVRLSSCNCTIGLEDVDVMVNLYNLWDRCVHYCYN